MNNQTSKTVEQPEPIADIVIRMFPGQTILDAFVETEDAYDRFVKEAPRYGNLDQHEDFDFLRLFVAPTFDVMEVKRYLERK